MRARRLRGLAAGLLVIAGAALAPAAPTRAAEGCAAVDDRDEMTVQVASPGVGERRTTANVPVEVRVTNTSTRRNIPTDPDPAVTRVRVTLLACGEGQILPSETQRTSSGPAADTLSLSWTTEPVPTNGPFAIEIVASGNRSGNPPQVSRVVVPFSLAVAPDPPTGVTATADASGVAVSWSNRDREPDLLFYEVQRAAQGSGSYVTIANGVVDARTASMRDNPGPGAWRYRVLAIRRGANSDEGLRSAPSADATVEISPPPPPPGSSTSTTAGSSGGTTGTTTRPSAGASPTATGGSARPAAAPVTGSGLRAGSGAAPSTVDLSNFAAQLNARRAPGQSTNVPDPGFTETLPFAPRVTIPSTEAAEEEALDDEPQELGAGGAAGEGLGERLISNADDRRRSMGFVAGGALLFVLSMTGLFLKSEVRRVDELEALGLDDPDSAAGPVPEASAGTSDVSSSEVAPGRGTGATPEPAPASLLASSVTAPAAPPAEPPAVAIAPDVPTVSPPLDPPGSLGALPAAAAAAAAAPAAFVGRRRRRDRRAGVTKQAAPEAAPVPDEAPERRAAAGPPPAAEPPRWFDSAPAPSASSGVEDGFDDLVDDEDEAAAAPPPRRLRRTMPPVDSPTLDIPEPPAPAPRTRTTSADARRTPARLPSRPAGDRREGGAAVRPRRRGAGEGDRRVPLG